MGEKKTLRVMAWAVFAAAVLPVGAFHAGGSRRAAAGVLSRFGCPPGHRLKDGVCAPAFPGLNGRLPSAGFRRPMPEMAGARENPATPEKIELGRQLFFDPLLSGDNTTSCAHCHHPDLGFSDGRSTSMGVGGSGVGPARSGGRSLPRGAPTLWNIGYRKAFFWDGRSPTLEDQAKGPVVSPDEMNQDAVELKKELSAIEGYRDLFDAAFGPGTEPTLDRAADALAAFERALVSVDSPFDRYAAGDADALTAGQRRGFNLFRSVGLWCFECHRMPAFAEPTFKTVGAPELDGKRIDPGRKAVTGAEGQFGAFLTPTLRNVAVTAPYMHGGRFNTLEEVLDFYAKGGGRGMGLDVPNIDSHVAGFDLSPQEKRDLVAFLESLTDESLKPDIPEKALSGLPAVKRIVGEAGKMGGEGD